MEGIVRANGVVCRKVCASFFKFNIGDARDAAARLDSAFAPKSCQARTIPLFSMTTTAETAHLSASQIICDEVLWYHPSPLKTLASIGGDLKACLKLTYMTGLAFPARLGSSATVDSSQHRSFSGSSVVAILYLLFRILNLLMTVVDGHACSFFDHSSGRQRRGSSLSDGDVCFCTDCYQLPHDHPFRRL